MSNALQTPVSGPSKPPVLVHAAALGLFGRIGALYRPEPAKPLLNDPTAISKAFAHWRWRMFAGMFFGYAVLYFCRKNISNALPVMGKDLGYTNVQLGIIGTTLYVTYGIGKFTNGVLADRSNIRRFMATGLIVSGLLNILFGSFDTIWPLALAWGANRLTAPGLFSFLSGRLVVLYLLAFVWGANGWFQSMGFPPIARGMTLWYPPEGKSTRWAFWTCSHQVGTAAIMAITAWILAWGTWRTCFWLPGILCVVVGFVLLFVLGDTPESRGLPSARAFDEAPKAGGTEADFKTAFIHHVLLNRNVWAIGLVDLCVYVVRYGTLDWSTKFMIEHKGYEIGGAALRAGLMPLAGVVGVLVSGFVADVVFRARYRILNLVFLLALAGCLYGFVALGSGHPTLDLVFLAGIGFFVEGPQSILGGVGAVDAGGSTRVASSAAGLVGILAYFGASLSGVGTGFFIDNYQWHGAFTFWITCALLGFLVCLVVWKEPAHKLA